MHRSGTSALARVVAAMGAYPGKQDELLPAHPRDNPAGYWERTDLMLAHDEFLRQAGYSWDRVAGFEPDRLDAEVRRALSVRLAETIGQLQGAGSPWLVKDPRLCLLLPLWLPLVGDAACVVAVRDPREIAASLVETHRGTYTSHFLLALWEKYTLAMLAGLRGRRALFVSYPKLLAEPAAQGLRLQQGLEELGVTGLTLRGRELSELLDTRLRRSTASAHVQLSPGQAALYRWLDGQTSAGGPVEVRDYPHADAPDAELAEFERTLDDCARRAREAATGEVNHNLARIEARLQEHEQERAAWLAEVTARREHNDQLQRAISEEHEGNLRLHQAVAEANLHVQQAAAEGAAHAAQLSARAAQLEEVVDAERSNAKALRESLEETSASLQAMRTDRDTLRGEIQRMESDQKTLWATLESLQVERSAARTALEQVMSDRDAVHAALAETVAEQEALRAAIDDGKSERDVLRAAIEDGESERDALRAAIEGGESERDALRANVEKIAAERDQLRVISEHASKELESQRRHADALQTGFHELQRSLSWRLMAPVRSIGHVSHWPVWIRMEQRLSRWYYALPGPDAVRKRRLIVWFHEHLPWITRGTVSYQIQTRSQTAARSGRRMDEERAAALLSELGARIRFSIVTLARDSEPVRLTAAVESVVRQFYPAWELHVVADESTAPETRSALDELARRDRRIKIKYLKKSEGVAADCNAAWRGTRGDYVVFLDADCELARDALLEMMRAITQDAADVVYSDEDTISDAGQHAEPFFKPDFSPDYLLSSNFIGRFAAVRRQLLQQVGGFRADFESAGDYDLLLRASENTSRIAHIPQVLYHRHRNEFENAESPLSTARATAGLDALRDSLLRRGVEAEVQSGRLPNTYRVRRRIAGKPLVSILLPFRDKPDLLRTCVSSVLEKTGYSNFELIGIDNGSVHEETHTLMRKLAAQDSRIRFIRHDVPFNYSAIVNFGATTSRGEHLLMLNNDTEVISEEWIDALLEHSQRPEVGAVGALLQYPNDSIQHAGVVVGLGGVAGHAHLMLPSRHPGYFGRAQVIQNLSAVTFACAMTRKDVFDRLGGLDAVNLTAAYNDIDYCLRLREAGYLIVYTPYSELYHHESASRPHDLHPAQRERYDREIRYMKERHAQILERGDPYYNPHLSLAQGYLPSADYADMLPG